MGDRGGSLDIIPFAGLRPHPNYLKELVSPAYDVIDRQEARKLAQNNPYSFLRVTRSDLEFGDEVDPYAPEIYERAYKNFHSFISKGVLIRENKKSYYIYSIEHPNGKQTGLLALFSAKDYEEGRIKKHELTQAKKEKDRTTHIKTLQAHTGPLLLLYRDESSKSLSGKLEDYLAKHEPLYRINFSEEQSIHSLYRIDDEEYAKEIEQSLSQLDCAYIADGHHRAASAVKASLDLSQEGKNSQARYFLAALFPDKQAQILPYYRVIRDLNHLSKEQLIASIEAKGIQIQEGSYSQLNKSQANMCLEGKWYRLEWKLENKDRLPESLAVNILQKKIFSPLLGISDPRRSERIAFVGGVHGEKGLEKLVSPENRKFSLAFSVCAYYNGRTVKGSRCRGNYAPQVHLV